MAHPTSVPVPARSIPVLAEFDVVVCGGGPAGCAAAVASARRGARTLLVERDGYLGGATVTQLVAVVLSSNGVDFQGIWHDYARKLLALHGMASLRVPREREGPGNHDITGTVDPERVKYAWDALLSEAGASILHHAYATEALTEEGPEGRVAAGVVVETRGGRRAVLARRVVDATGDGYVCAASGVPWSQGDGEHPWAMACTKTFRIGNVEWDADRFGDEVMREVERRLDQAIARGEYTTPVVTTKTRLLGYIRNKSWRLPGHRREVLSILSRVLEVDPLDPFDFTRAEREGRTQASEAADAYRRFVPGCERSYLLDTGSQIGVRSSRRIHGLATVQAEDAVELRKHPDSVARASWTIDVWPASSYTAAADAHPSEARRARLAAGDYYDLRYGCIVAQGVDNLYVAGRCVSAEHTAQSSLRLQQTCMSLGQAAGTAAALGLRHNEPASNLDTKRLGACLAEDREAAGLAFPELAELPGVLRPVAR